MTEYSYLQWINKTLSKLIGDEAERLACAFLEQQGLVYLQKNYRCRTGEIDLIMRDNEELVFVEVKFRSKNQHGTAVEFFHASKRRKFESAVMHYLQEKKLNPSIVAYRIDLVGIEGKGQQSKINWLKSV